MKRRFYRRKVKFFLFIAVLVGLWIKFSTFLELKFYKFIYPQIEVWLENVTYPEVPGWIKEEIHYLIQLLNKALIFNSHKFFLFEWLVWGALVGIILPALILFVFTIIGCFKITYHLYKGDRDSFPTFSSLKSHIIKSYCRISFFDLGKTSLITLAVGSVIFSTLLAVRTHLIKHFPFINEIFLFCFVGYAYYLYIVFLKGHFPSKIIYKIDEQLSLKNGLSTIWDKGNNIKQSVLYLILANWVCDRLKRITPEEMCPQRLLSLNRYNFFFPLLIITGLSFSTALALPTILGLVEKDTNSNLIVRDNIISKKPQKLAKLDDMLFLQGRNLNQISKQLTNESDPEVPDDAVALVKQLGDELVSLSKFEGQGSRLAGQKNKLSTNTFKTGNENIFLSKNQFKISREAVKSELKDQADKIKSNDSQLYESVKKILQDHDALSSNSSQAKSFIAPPNIPQFDKGEISAQLRKLALEILKYDLSKISSNQAMPKKTEKKSVILKKHSAKGTRKQVKTKKDAVKKQASDKRNEKKGRTKKSSFRNDKIAQVNFFNSEKTKKPPDFFRQDRADNAQTGQASGVNKYDVGKTSLSPQTAVNKIAGLDGETAGQQGEPGLPGQDEKTITSNNQQVLGEQFPAVAYNGPSNILDENAVSHEIKNIGENLISMGKDLAQEKTPGIGKKNGQQKANKNRKKEENIQISSPKNSKEKMNETPQLPGKQVEKELFVKRERPDNIEIVPTEQLNALPDEYLEWYLEDWKEQEKSQPAFDPTPELQEKIKVSAKKLELIGKHIMQINNPQDIQILPKHREEIMKLFPQDTGSEVQSGDRASNARKIRSNASTEEQGHADIIGTELQKVLTETQEWIIPRTGNSDDESGGYKHQKPYVAGGIGKGNKEAVMVSGKQNYPVNSDNVASVRLQSLTALVPPEKSSVNVFSKKIQKTDKLVQGIKHNHDSVLENPGMGALGSTMKKGSFLKKQRVRLQQILHNIDRADDVEELKKIGQRLANLAKEMETNSLQLIQATKDEITNAKNGSAQKQTGVNTVETCNRKALSDAASQLAQLQSAVKKTNQKDKLKEVAEKMLELSGLMGVDNIEDRRIAQIGSGTNEVNSETKQMLAVSNKIQEQLRKVRQISNKLRKESDSEKLHQGAEEILKLSQQLKSLNSNGKEKTIAVLKEKIKRQGQNIKTISGKLAREKDREKIVSHAMALSKQAAGLSKIGDMAIGLGWKKGAQIKQYASQLERSSKLLQNQDQSKTDEKILNKKQGNEMVLKQQARRLEELSKVVADSQNTQEVKSAADELIKLSKEIDKTCNNFGFGKEKSSIEHEEKKTVRDAIREGGDKLQQLLTMIQTHQGTLELGEAGLQLNSVANSLSQLNVEGLSKTERSNLQKVASNLSKTAQDLIHGSSDSETQAVSEGKRGARKQTHQKNIFNQLTPRLRKYANLLRNIGNGNKYGGKNGKSIASASKQLKQLKLGPGKPDGSRLLEITKQIDMLGRKLKQTGTAKDEKHAGRSDKASGTVNLSNASKGPIESTQEVSYKEEDIPEMKRQMAIQKIDEFLEDFIKHKQKVSMQSAQDIAANDDIRVSGVSKGIGGNNRRSLVSRGNRIRGGYGVSEVPLSDHIDNAYFMEENIATDTVFTKIIERIKNYRAQLQSVQLSATEGKLKRVSPWRQKDKASISQPNLPANLRREVGMPETLSANAVNKLLSAKKNKNKSTVSYKDTKSLQQPHDVFKVYFKENELPDKKKIAPLEKKEVMTKTLSKQKLADKQEAADSINRTPIPQEYMDIIRKVCLYPQMSYSYREYSCRSPKFIRN